MNPLYGVTAKTFKHHKCHEKRSNFQQYMMSQQFCARKIRIASLHMEAFVHEIPAESRDTIVKLGAVQDSCEVKQVKCIDEGELMEMYANSHVEEDDVCTEKSSDLGESDSFQTLSSDFGENFSDQISSPDFKEITSFHSGVNCSVKTIESPNMASHQNGELEAGIATGKIICQSDKETFTTLSIASGFAYVSRCCSKNSVKMQQEPAMPDQVIDITELSENEDEVLKKSGVSVGLLQCQRNCGHSGIEVRLKLLSPVVSVSCYDATGLEELTQSVCQSSSSDVTISPDSLHSSLAKRQRKLRKRKIVNYYPFKGKEKFQLVHQSCPKKKKLARVIYPFIASGNNRGSKKIKSIVDVSAETEKSQNTLGGKYKTGKTLSNTNITTSNNRDSQMMNFEIAEMEKVRESGSKGDKTLDSEVKVGHTTGSREGTDNEFDKIDDTAINTVCISRSVKPATSENNSEKETESEQNKDCLEFDQPTAKSIYQRIWERTDPTACETLERERLQFMSSAARSCHDFDEVESLPDIDSCDIETDCLLDNLTDENEDSQNLHEDERMISDLHSESNNVCTTLINYGDQGNSYSLRKRPKVDYLKTKISCYGIVMRENSKVKDISLGNKTCECLPNDSIEFENSDSAKGELFQSSGQQNPGQDKKSVTRLSAKHNSTDSIANRKRYRKAKLDSNKNHTCPSLRKKAKIEYFATKINIGNKKKDIRTDKTANTLKDQNCMVTSTVKNNSDRNGMNISDENGSLAEIEDIIKFKMDQPRRYNTKCDKDNMLDGAARDISNNESDDIMFQNPYELDFSNPDTTSYCLQDRKTQVKNDSDEDIFAAEDKETVSSSDRVSLMDLSSPIGNFSPLESVEEKEKLTENNEKDRDMFSKSRLIKLEDKASENKSDSLSVEMDDSESYDNSTGISHVKGGLPFSLVEKETGSCVNIQESVLKSDNLQQTTIDKFFRVLKLDTSVQSSKANLPENKAGNENANLFRNMENKEPKENDSVVDIMDTSDHRIDTTQIGKEFVQVDVFVIGPKEYVEESQIGAKQSKALIKDTVNEGESLKLYKELPCNEANRKDVKCTKTGETSLLCHRSTGNKMIIEKCTEMKCEGTSHSMNAEKDLVCERTSAMRKPSSPECGNVNAKMVEADSTMVGDDIVLVEKGNELESDSSVIENDAVQVEKRKKTESDSSVAENDVRMVETENEQSILSSDIPVEKNLNENRILTVDSTVTSKKGIQFSTRDRYSRYCKDMMSNSRDYSRMNISASEGGTKTVSEGKNKVKAKNASMFVSGRPSTMKEDCDEENRNKSMREEQCKKENNTDSQKQVRDMNSQNKNGRTVGVTKKSVQQRNFKQSDYPVGSVVWGKFSQSVWWPALVVNAEMVNRPTKKGFIWLYWLSDRRISQVRTTCVEPFQETFVIRSKHKTQKTMQFGIDRALEVCACRADVDLKEFGTTEAWLKSDRGFLQIDSDRFKPAQECPVPADILEDLNCTHLSIEYIVNEQQRKNGRDVTSCNLAVTSTFCAANTSEETNVDQSGDSINFVRQEICVEKEGTCFTCGLELVEDSYSHPLFQGQICEKCKENLKEGFYAVDDDGYGMFCSICGNGGDLFLCSGVQCRRSFCFTCVQKHTSSSIMQKIKVTDNWICFLCAKYKSSTHRDLIPHEDGSREIINFFQPRNTSVCTELQSLKRSGHRKMRVLSLFDGIGLGKVALDELGLDVDVYYAAEINPDAVQIANFHHKPVQLGDVLHLDRKKLEELCPIDLVLARPPSDDLSIVNPERKGFNGTGILLWRVQNILKDIEIICKGTNHVFWLMENSGTMLNEYKENINREFGMEPVVRDAKCVTGKGERARNFWGNIPGMCNTPQFRTQLSSALISNCKRKSQVSHTKTITSETVTSGVNNAVVSMNGDGICVQELERLFGFPAHYTDCGELTHEQRKELLKKSQSVSVMKHLLSPLKQYFKIKHT